MPGARGETKSSWDGLELRERWTSDLLETVTDQADDPDVIDGAGKLLEILGVLNSSGMLDIVVTLMQFAGLMPDAGEPSDIVDTLWAFYDTHAGWVKDLQGIQADKLAMLTKMLSDPAVALPAASLLNSATQAGTWKMMADVAENTEVLAALPKLLALVGKLQDEGLVDSLLLALDYMDALPDIVNTPEGVDRLADWLQQSKIIETAAATNWGNLVAVTRMASQEPVRKLMELGMGLLEDVPSDILADMVSLIAQGIETVTALDGWSLAQDVMKMAVQVKTAVDWAQLFPGVTDAGGHLNWQGIVQVIQNVAADTQHKTSAFGGMKGMMALMRDPDVQKGLHFLTSLTGQLSHFAMSPRGSEALS